MHDSKPLLDPARCLVTILLARLAENACFHVMVERQDQPDRQDQQQRTQPRTTQVRDVTQPQPLNDLGARAERSAIADQGDDGADIERLA